MIVRQASKIPRLCRDVFARYGGNDEWNVSAHKYVYMKIFFFYEACMSANVGEDTIIRDLPRIHDSDAISRDKDRFLSPRSWIRATRMSNIWQSSLNFKRLCTLSLACAR